MPSERKWNAPTSIADAGARRDTATEQLFAIDAALATTKGVGARSTLMQRKNGLVVEIRRLKAWFRENDAQRITAATSDKADKALLRAAYTLLGDLQKDGVDLDPSELEVIDALKTRLSQ